MTCIGSSFEQPLKRFVWGIYCVRHTNFTGSMNHATFLLFFVYAIRNLKTDTQPNSERIQMTLCDMA